MNLWNGFLLREVVVHGVLVLSELPKLATSSACETHL